MRPLLVEDERDERVVADFERLQAEHDRLVVLLGTSGTLDLESLGPVITLGSRVALTDADGPATDRADRGPGGGLPRRGAHQRHARHWRRAARPHGRRRVRRGRPGQHMDGDGARRRASRSEHRCPQIHQNHLLDLRDRGPRLGHDSRTAPAPDHLSEQPRRLLRTPARLRPGERRLVAFIHGVPGSDLAGHHASRPPSRLRQADQCCGADGTEHLGHGGIAIDWVAWVDDEDPRTRDACRVRRSSTSWRRPSTWSGSRSGANLSTNGRMWWSHSCTDPACCPPQGTPLDRRSS